MAHGAEGAAKAGNWQSPFRQLPGSRGAWGKHSQQSRAQGEGGREGGKACLGPQPGMAGPSDVGNGEGKLRGEREVISAPGWEWEKQGAGDRDVPIPQGCCSSTGSGGFKYSMISPVLIGRISQLSRKDSKLLQERFPVSPERISYLTWEGFPTSAGGIPCLSRKDFHSSKRNFPFPQAGFHRREFHNPPGGIPHPLQEYFSHPLH